MKPSSALAAGALVFALGCNMSVRFDPEGYACDPGNICPNGFICREGVCRDIMGVGGGAAGGAGGGGGGAAGGAGGGADLCATVSCGTPPPPQCLDADTQRSFAVPGSCNSATGGCEYTPADKKCAQGCTAGLCVGDPCSTVTCNTPPNAVCKDATTLITYGATGSCSNGQCNYPPQDQTCLNGCAANKCTGQNLCAGVTCNLPPSPVCVGNVARTFLAPGVCNLNNGACVYSPLDLNCAGGCANGACITSGQTFTQTMPRVRFAVNAVDQAPGSSGNHVLVAGAGGNVAKWDGQGFTKVTSISSTNAAFTAVWFTGPNSAVLVGSARTVARYNGTAYGIVAAVPGSGSASFIGVHGKDDMNFVVADEAGGWYRFAAGTWTSGLLPGGSTYKMSAVYVDAPSNRARIAGQRTTTGGVVTGLVAYNDPALGVTWFDDLDTAGLADGFGAVGPAFSGGTALSDTVFLGRANSNALRRHTNAGSFDSVFTPTLTLPTGAGLSGITATAGSVGRAVFLLSKVTASQVGHLYRYHAGGLEPTALADFWFDRAAMSLTESGGVIVAEADTTHQVNNIYRRGAITNEMLDLGESWSAVTGTPLALVLVSRFGDVAFRPVGAATWQFRRGPTISVTDATAANSLGNTALLVGTGGALERASLTGAAGTFTAIASGTTSAFRAVCRVSDLEAWAVGDTGVLRSINTTTATATTVASGTTRNLLAVDCPAPGMAVACGASGAIQRRVGGAWSALTPAFPGTPDLTSCKLVGSTLWVAGDGVFARVDLGVASPVWQTLAANPRLSQLEVLSANDVYALSGNLSVVRFDGTGWSTKTTLSSGTLVGGSQVGGKVVYAGDFGTVVEGQ